MLTTEAALGMSGTVTGQMIILNTAAPSFPPGSIPICDLALNAGKYTIDACGLASRVRAAAFDAGSGINIAYTAGVGKITTDVTVGRVDGTNVWTGANDFRNGSVILPASVNVRTNRTALCFSVLSLILAIIAALPCQQEASMKYFAFLLACFASQAAVIKVGTVCEGSCGFPNTAVQAAIDIAKGGDIIELSAGENFPRR